jgi:C-22 sterol desaturase
VQWLTWTQDTIGFGTLAATVLLIALLYDQFSYVKSKGSIAGPPLKMWPIIGPFLDSINPDFEKYKAQWASGALSCVSVFHKFVVLASDRDLTRKIFNSSAYVKPCVVDVAIKILRPTNWVFLDGKAHVDYRRGLNGLFTNRALSMYLPIQEGIYDTYFDKFVEMSKDGHVPYMPIFREINCALSLRTFCGNYITEEQIKEIAHDYYLVTAALELVNFPIILPFTKAWYGKKAADKVMDIFAKCAQMAKDHIKAGGDVTCTMDAWIAIMNGRDFDSDHGTVPNKKIRKFTNKEISETIFTFLFASQDASSSATTWLFQIVADRPDVYAKIREEQLAVRGGDPNVPLSLELTEKMTYTNMVVKECLRLRPPVIMVPYVAKKDFPISDTYTVPKGSMIIPTVYPSLHDPEVYERPDEFVPERWLPDGDGTKNAKNWLVFGTGPHYCLGQKYALMNFTNMIGKACMNLDFTHKVTPLSEKVRVFATIFPDDDCLLQFKKRE